VAGGRKINWVKWSKVCQPKEKGGLGIRDIRLVNLSLLSKWRWRFLQNEGTLWKEVLIEKYGHSIGDLLHFESDSWPRFASRWWKDIVTLDDGGGVSCYDDEVIKRVNNGQSTSFWNSKWRGDMSFRMKYPRLFSISIQKEAKVVDMWLERGTESDWNFSWRRRLFVWEEDLIHNLMLDLHGFEWGQGVDEWFWRLEKGGVFSVKSTYKKLAEVSLADNLWGEEEEHVFGQIWKSPAPSKVVALSWRGLLDHVPTRVNLARRNVLPPNASLR